MNMLEAIKEAKARTKPMLFRPVGWKGCAMRLEHNGHIYLVIDHKAAWSAFMPLAKECLGEWEVLTKDDLSKE